MASIADYAAARLCTADGEGRIYEKEEEAYLVHMPPQLALVIKTLIENFHHLDKIKSTTAHAQPLIYHKQKPRTVNMNNGQYRLAP